MKDSFEHGSDDAGYVTGERYFWPAGRLQTSPEGPSSSSVGATTLGGFWPALRFCSTIFYLYISLSSFSLSSSLDPLPQIIIIILFALWSSSFASAGIIIFSLLSNVIFSRVRSPVASRTPNPLPRRTGVSLLVWIITFDLSGKGGPTCSYATAGIALRIIWPLKPSHYFKVETPSGGPEGPCEVYFLHAVNNCAHGWRHMKWHCTLDWNVTTCLRQLVVP